MNTFTLIIRKGPYNSRINPVDWIPESPIQSFDQVVADVCAGEVDAEDIAKVVTINLTNGTALDVTSEVAEAVWRDFDANNTYAWNEMRAWLESFNHDCEHLTGETQDIRHFYGE